MWPPLLVGFKSTECRCYGVGAFQGHFIGPGFILLTGNFEGFGIYQRTFVWPYWTVPVLAHGVERCSQTHWTRGLVCQESTDKTGPRAQGLFAFSLLFLVVSWNFLNTRHQQPWEVSLATSFSKKSSLWGESEVLTGFWFCFIPTRPLLLTVKKELAVPRGIEWLSQHSVYSHTMHQAATHECNKIFHECQRQGWGKSGSVKENILYGSVQKLGDGSWVDTDCKGRAMRTPGDIGTLCILSEC